MQTKSIYEYFVADFPNNILDKESIYELQKIDCNCNDCKFMVRDSERHKTAVATHFKWQFDEFFKLRLRLANVEMKKTENEKPSSEKHNNIMKLVVAMKFQFDSKEASINYGDCSKFNKPISFIPVTLQLETQECFEHRKD